MIKNFIFDFGNVIARYKPYEIVNKYINDDKTCQLLSELIFDYSYWRLLDEGLATDEEYKNLLLKRTPDDLKEIAVRIFDNWIDSMPPVEKMEKLISDLSKTNKKLYLLSNISVGFSENYKKTKWIKDVFEHFDGLLFSGVVKMIKPDERIFYKILETYNLKAEECLFIDDMEKNIKGAELVGIKGYLFDGDADKLREYLNML